MAEDASAGRTPTSRQRKAVDLNRAFKSQLCTLLAVLHFLNWMTNQAVLQCINCYEKKIKCNYSPEIGNCCRCRQHGLECVIPDGNLPKARSSLRHVSHQDVEISTSLTDSARRETVQELESCVQSLESAALASSVTSQIQPTGYQGFVPSPWKNQRPYDPSEHPTWNCSKSSTSSSVPLTRGTTPPWTTLLAGTANADIPSFHESASQISGQET